MLEVDGFGIEYGLVEFCEIVVVVMWVVFFGVVYEFFDEFCLFDVL